MHEHGQRLEMKPRSQELWNDTVDFRGHQWRTEDISDELEHAWIRHFGPYRQRIHQVFGCRVPIFVNWYALLHRDITNSDPYNRAWGTVGLTMLYNPECSFVTLSVLDRGPKWIRCQTCWFSGPLMDTYPSLW